MMYRLPFLYGGIDKAIEVDMDDVEEFENQCRMKDFPCDPEIFELSCLLIEEHNLVAPENSSEAVDLYVRLRELILLAL